MSHQTDLVQPQWFSSSAGLLTTTCQLFQDQVVSGMREIRTYVPRIPWPRKRGLSTMTEPYGGMLPPYPSGTCIQTHALVRKKMYK